MHKYILLLMVALPLLGVQKSMAEEEHKGKGDNHTSPTYSDSDIKYKVVTNESKSYLLDKIDKMETNLSILQNHVYGEKGSANKAASLDANKESAVAPTVLVQFDEIREITKELRGKVEELQHKYEQLNEKLVKSTADIEYRLSEMQKEISKQTANDKALEAIDMQLDNKVVNNKMSDQASLKDKKASTSPFIKVSDGEKLLTPDEQYQNAYNLIKNKNYPAAQSALQRFVDDNSGNQLVGNAYYWIGEVDFLQNNFEEAAVQYLKGYQAAPAGNKAADNLLKLGLCLKKLDKRKEACITLTKLDKEFPDASSVIKKRLAVELKQLVCE